MDTATREGTTLERHSLRGAIACGLLSCGLILLAAAGCGTEPFDGDLAYSLLVRQCEFGPRSPGSVGHEAMLDWLVSMLDERAERVSVQRFVASDTTGAAWDGANVIASFRVDRPERILLGAHWDTRAVADRDPDPAARGLPVPGANDGASGVAVLLALADLMSRRAPALGVDLVFFDLEDGGKGGGFGSFCLGSEYFARKMGAYAPRYAVVVDMIGDADLLIPIEPNSAGASPQVVGEVWEAAERVGASSFTRERGTPIFDDHVPLIRAGVPAVVLIDFDYAHWHTLEDTPDKCSPASLAEVGDVLAELVY